MSEAVELLRSIDQTLKRLEAILATPSAKRRARPASQKHAERLVRQGREESADPAPIDLVPQYWREACPGHPQPLQLTLERREKIRAFWNRFVDPLTNPHPDEHVKAVFELVASSRFLGAEGKFRPDLFWVIEHVVEILEGKYP